MAGSKRKFRHESLESAESISGYLEALLNGVRSGELVFQNEDDRIVLRPRGLLGFQVSATQKRDHVRLKLELSWRAGEDSGKAGLSIESGD